MKSHIVYDTKNSSPEPTDKGSKKAKKETKRLVSKLLMLPMFARGMGYDPLFTRKIGICDYPFSDDDDEDEEKDTE